MELLEIISQYGLTVVLAVLFIKNSLDSKAEMQRLHEDYIRTQKEDKQEYIKLNEKMITAIGELSQDVKELQRTIKK